MLFDGDAPLTSESVKQTINRTLMERGCDPLTPIVAGGEQGCDPHDRGSGPLAANVPIILDIFPCDLSTRYHGEVKQVFEERGYETGQKDGRMVGFFHGTGHGLGLDVHEYPGVGAADHMLKAGHVVTVEPGLYYPGVGGIRIEDDVLVTEDGHENLCELEVVFEV
jgi:Xaa-Pro aminopeptidase